eukprot:SAG22_NODE_62_length_23371_cov_84.500602_5_plen_175_part_00
MALGSSDLGVVRPFDPVFTRPSPADKRRRGRTRICGGGICGRTWAIWRPPLGACASCRLWLHLQRRGAPGMPVSELCALRALQLVAITVLYLTAARAPSKSDIFYEVQLYIYLLRPKTTHPWITRNIFYVTILLGLTRLLCACKFLNLDLNLAYSRTGIRPYRRAAAAGGTGRR